MQELWTLEDIVAWLGKVYKPRTIKEKLIHQPGFPKPMRPMGKRVWHASEVMAWLESTREAA